jgi:hypothetical protein
VCKWKNCRRDKGETSPYLVLLQSTESHLGSRNVLLWVLQVLEKSVLIPDDTLLLVGISEGEALSSTRLAAEETVKVWSDLVGSASLESVALSATGLEEVGSLGVVSWRGGGELVSALRERERER